MNQDYEAIISKIKSGDYAYNSNEFNEYVGFFLDETIKEQRFQLYVEKMKEKELSSLAEAKHLFLKQIFEEYIQFSLTEANVAAKNNNESDAKTIIDQLSKLRDVFKNHDVADYKAFILQSESNINELEVELLFLEPALNVRELDKLTDAFVKAFKNRKKAPLGIDKTEFQKKFFNHPLMQCLNAYSDFKTIQKHIDKETITLGNYKNLVQAMLGLREKVNAEEYQGFITFVIHEDLTYGLNNILKDDNYKPSYLRNLLIEMADGKPLENKTVKDLIGQIKVEHTKNLAFNTKKELITNTSSIASLNDYGFDINLNGHHLALVFHGHATENAGGNQREQQANTAFTIRNFNKDTIGLTVLKDEITRTDHHANFLTDFSHMITMSKTEEIILSGLQFDASNLKCLALNASLQSLKDGDFLNSNHYIVKADIKRSQDIINNNLGKNDLELLCEKKNAYMGIVDKNKELFKSVIETTSTNNQLSFQLFSKPFIEFIDSVINIEEEAKIKIFTNEEIELVQEVLSVKCNNLELETAKRKCIKAVKNRDVENCEDVRSYTFIALSHIGVFDREMSNRLEETKKSPAKNHMKVLKNPGLPLDFCLEYLDNNPVDSREYPKAYKTKVINALKEKIILTAEEKLAFPEPKKSELMSGIIDVTDSLKEGNDIVFSKEDIRLSASKFNCRKTLASLIGGRAKDENQKAASIGVLIGLLALADLCGTKLIHEKKNSKSCLREENLLMVPYSDEDMSYFGEQDESELKKKVKVGK